MNPNTIRAEPAPQEGLASSPILDPRLQDVVASLEHYAELYPRERREMSVIISSAVEGHEAAFSQALHDPQQAAAVVKALNGAHRRMFQPVPLDTFIQKLYLDNFDALITHFNQATDETSTNYASQAICTAIEPVVRRPENIDYDDPIEYQRQQAIETFLSIVPRTMHEHPDRGAFLPLSSIYDYGNPEQIDRANNISINFLQDEDPAIVRFGIEMLPNLMGYSNEEQIRTHIEPIAESLIAAHGIPPEVASLAWQTVRTERSYAVALTNNLLTMQALEEARPGEGICAVIYQEFGILNFAERPLDMLIRQFDERDESGPFILMTFPGYDGSEAYSASHKETVAQYTKIHDQAASRGIHVRMTEARTKEDLKSIQRAMSRRYGLITDWNIHSHGDGKALVLSEQYAQNPEDGYVRMDDVDSVMQRECLASEIRINTLSCSGGSAEGIAQAIHLATGASVLSPARAGLMSTLDLHQDKYGQNEWSMTYKWGVEDIPVVEYKNELTI